MLRGAGIGGLIRWRFSVLPCLLSAGRSPLRENRGSAGGGSRRLRDMAAAALVVVLGLLYGPICRDMIVQWWADPNYSHGFLVPLFSGYLIWQERDRLRATPLRPSWFGLAVFLAGIGMLILGVVGAENFLARSSLVVIASGLVLFHAGPAM